MRCALKQARRRINRTCCLHCSRPCAARANAACARAAASDGSAALCARINCHALVVGTCFVAFVVIAVCGAAAYYLRAHALRVRHTMDLEAMNGARPTRPSSHTTWDG